MRRAVPAAIDHEAGCSRAADRLVEESAGARASRRVRRTGVCALLPVSSATKGEGSCRVGQDEDLADGARQRHMEDATFALLVVTQPVREEALGRAVDDDVLPLPALDLVDRRQVHRRPLERSSAEGVPQPRLEGGDVGVEGRQRLEGQEIVGMGRPVRLAPGRIEHVHGLAEADVGTDSPDGGRARRAAGAGHGVDGIGVVGELGDVASRQAPGQAPDVLDGGHGPFRQHFGDIGRNPSRGTTDRLGDVLPPDRIR